MDLNQYSEQLRATGLRVVAGSERSLWVSHERFAMQRQPHCTLHVPGPDEIAEVFKRTHAPLLSFVTHATLDRVANSCLYICKDPEYSMGTLTKGPRYDVRRGFAELQIRPADKNEILEKGLQAYCDTRARTGLSGGTREAFQARFGCLQPGTQFFGAFKEERLAAFFTATEVDDWVSIGGWSGDEFLPLRPNNALVYYAVHYYLVERKLRIVSYGLSSVQAVTNAEGLHRFKVKMGFEALPVHRAFVVNPLLRPFVNRGSWKLAHSLLKLAPRNPMLKKAEGALRMALCRYS